LDPPWQWILGIAAVALALYTALVVVLLVAGRSTQARALAGFIPDCIVLFRRLLGDPRVPRRRKLALVVLIAYLANPIDLVPDFFPGIGQLDDALAVALVLRYVLRSGGADLLREHWPGPQASLALVTRLAYGNPSQREGPPTT
jgi:uncharacterized membrane protein YkvA (DUF1232 family)